MSFGPSPSGWLDRLVGACLTLLIGAIAIFVAVRLIEAVWQGLLAVLGVLLLLGIGVAVAQARFRGW